MNISENIKAVARAHGKTISQLAAEIGVLQPHLSRTINNERISLKDMATLAGAIGCDISDFFAPSGSGVIRCPHCGGEIRFVKPDAQS